MLYSSKTIYDFGFMMYDLRLPRWRKGFSLIEAVVAIAIFLLFVTGIYAGSLFVFKSVYDSRLRILESGLLNEQIEIIRNLPWSDVGIVNGSPAGVLTRTATTTRNGIAFTITRTIRNIDDPYDGTIGGTPNDIAPADYKLVEVEIICDDCPQGQPLQLTATVGPRALEGDPTHGALFVEVFDAAAIPVSGATVHVVASSTDSTIDLIDTTDNDGMLKLVDLPSGVGAYAITVTKDGYTTEETIAPSEAVPNPVHPLASVIAQNVTEISFAIDRVSALSFATLDAACVPVPAVPITLTGSKLIGISPDVPKVDRSFATDPSGQYLAGDLDWDNYAPAARGYDVIGTIPQLPISLPSGVTQPVQFIVGAATDRSLVVNVRDSVTKQPVASAAVSISGPESAAGTTGVGHIRQTDWSGGSGQETMINPAQYFAEDGFVETNDPVGNLKLRLSGVNYAESGMLESSIFDVGVTPNYVNLVWEPFSQPAETGPGSLRFQLASSASSTLGAWDYLGPDGTSATFYDDTNPVLSQAHNGDQYFRYRVFLTTASTTHTPVLSDVSVGFTNACTPPGQAYFGSLQDGTYTVSVSAGGYQDATGDVQVTSDASTVIELTAE